MVGFVKPYNSKSMKKIQTLTRAEEEVMHQLWDLSKAYVKDLVDKMNDPKPAYNTISTIVRILEKKGFVGYEKHGKSHKYFPLIEKEDYTRFTVTSVVDNYFEGSFKKLVSFFIQEEKVSEEELRELTKKIEDARS